MLTGWQARALSRSASTLRDLKAAVVAGEVAATDFDVVDVWSTGEARLAVGLRTRSNSAFARRRSQHCAVEWLGLYQTSGV